MDTPPMFRHVDLRLRGWFDVADEDPDRVELAVILGDGTTMDTAVVLLSGSSLRDAQAIGQIVHAALIAERSLGAIL